MHSEAVDSVAFTDVPIANGTANKDNMAPTRIDFLKIDFINKLALS